MTTLNRSRIYQVIETIRAVHEQAPDVTIRVQARDPNTGRVSSLTLANGKMFEGTESSEDSEVGPHEDPLAIAASMVDDLRTLCEPRVEPALLHTMDVSRDKAGNIIRCRFCSAFGRPSHDSYCHGVSVEMRGEEV